MALEQFIATNWWVAQLRGFWREHQTHIHEAPPHTLPAKIETRARQKWDDILRKQGERLVGEENYELREEPNGYNRLFLHQNGEWKPNMFPGPQTRIEELIEIDDQLHLVHSQTNYAASMATSNTNPWGLIKEYGDRNALADGHAVSVAVIGVNEAREPAIQYFTRGDTVGEYAGKIGTAAGNSGLVSKTPFDIAREELREESGLIVGRKGLADVRYEGRILPEHGAQIEYHGRRGTEYGTFVDDGAEFILLGAALNVDPFDVTPHHKTEYLFVLNTQLPIETLNNSKHGWRRSAEHDQTLYVELPHLSEFIVEEAKNMMPPTQALSTMIIGSDAYFRARNDTAFFNIVDALNSTYPIEESHPLQRVIEQGRYSGLTALTRER